MVLQKRRHSGDHLPGIGPKLIYAGRRFNAWWEGYGFEPVLERRSILLNASAAKHLTTISDQADFVCEAVWGPGRLSPGTAGWSMRLARTLMIDAKARIAVFGAERGAVLKDLKAELHWQVNGYAGLSGKGPVQGVADYSKVQSRHMKPSLDGAMMLFELHHETDPAGLLKLMQDMMKPGARAVLIDFTSLRKGVRLKQAFAAPWQGMLRQSQDYTQMLQKAGFAVEATLDDTPQFLPLVTRGWAGWRYAWQILSDVNDNRTRAALLRLMSDYAAMWAERYDAMQSGQLQVTRFMVEKPRTAMA